MQEKGTIIRFSFDFMYPVRFLSIPKSFIYLGPCYASFKGNFKFIGNNEDFDVTSKHWGFGAGLESGFPISKKLGFTINAGFDYYKPATLYGHDTSYAPDGESVNPREDYQYSDANEAINQPGLELRLMLGFNYRFGK